MCKQSPNQCLHLLRHVRIKVCPTHLQITKHEIHLKDSCIQCSVQNYRILRLLRSFYLN